MRAIIPIPAFSDNYIWLLHDGHHAALVDPGDADPALDALSRLGLKLEAVLLTHHHPDHVGGVPALLDATSAQIYASERLVAQYGGMPLRGGERVHLARPELVFDVLAVPGHTNDHLAFHGEGALFCGDTLFAAGCGRLFEGSAEQMHSSLISLSALPGETKVYCAHEYTIANLRFARAVEPGNERLAMREREAIDLRARALPTVPSTLESELATNPFLRCGEPAVAMAASRHAGRDLRDPVAVFAALRSWKDGFRAY